MQFEERVRIKGSYQGFVSRVRIKGSYQGFALAMPQKGVTLLAASAAGFCPLGPQRLKPVVRCAAVWHA